MDGALKGDSFWDIYTQDILRCGAVHQCKGAPPRARLTPLQGNRGSSALSAHSKGCMTRRVPLSAAIAGHTK